MQTIVAELRNIIPFKKTTEIGDIVLITAKKPQMLVYAFVNNIERDNSRKDEWWHVHMTLFSVPLQKITWTLRTEQMTGDEIFTMGGEERFVQAVDISKHGQPVKQKLKTKTPIKKKKGLKRVK